MSSSIIARINNFLDIYATSDIINRGEQLFNDNRILNVDFFDSKTSAFFKVLGTRLYTVKIKGLNTSIHAECSCPYDWGPVCKHQVAAFKFLIKEFGGEVVGTKQEKVKLKKNVAIQVSKQRKSSDTFIIKNADLITKEYVSLHNVYDLGNLYLGSCLTTLIAPNKLHFELENSSYYYNEDYSVKFWHTPQGLKTVCSCGKTVKTFCHHQLHILSGIASSTQPDIFNLIRPKNLKKVKNDLLALYGLPKGQFDEYLELDYFNFELESVLKNKYLHLLPVNENNFETFLNNLDNDLLRIEKPIGIVESKEIRHLGFSIQLGDEVDDKTDPEYNQNLLNEISVIGISGKENKTQDKMISNLKSLEQLSKKEHVIISKPQQEILQKISFFETNIELSSHLSSSEKYRTQQFTTFGFLKEVFPMLAREKYTYVNIYNRYDGKIRKSDLVPVKISTEKPELEFDVVENGIFLEIIPKYRMNGMEYSSDEINRLYSNFFFTTVDNTLYLHKSISQCLLMYQFLGGKSAMVKSEADAFFEKCVKPVAKHGKINFKTDIFSYQEIKINPLKKQVYLSEYGEYVAFKPIVKYENEMDVLLGSSMDSIRKNEKNEIIRFIRDDDYENRFMEFMIALHPEFENQIHSGLFYLDFNELMENYWFFDAYEKMENEGIEVFGLKDLKSFKYAPYRAKVNTGIKSGQDWFEVDIDIAFGDNSIDLKAIRKALLKKEKYIRLSDGSMGILPEEWFNKLESYFRAGEIKDNKLQISKLRFSIIDELFDEIDDVEILKELAGKRRKLKTIENIRHVRKPKEITAVLRDYQKEGLNWLNLLNEMGWGGILADDMGLGKTLQILSLLQKQVKKSKKTNLVIVPTTLLFNWEMELKKFAPALTYHFYYGINRDKEIKYFKGYHIVFTTYGVLVRDIEFLRKFKFNYVILDESQAIKNPASKRYKAAFLLQATNKLTLTGTPIENSTFDLFAQMNFVNPGFLGSLKSFKDQYSNAIDKEGNVEVSQELNKIISPFILRRTKDQVAKDLPPKTENILYCEMAKEQRAVYDAFRNKYRDSLMDKIKSDGLGKSKLFVLEGLMKLRQICDSPAILSDDENYGTQSVKIEELVRHINEKTSHHKILVFSQFVRMLKLIREELIRDKIDFEYLDGQSSSKDREQSVNHFQEDTECRVFLISLKAGGTGLNLTAADYVYIVDPWWNPAAENQAIDRTHRIGQGKNVFAYRMICKDSVEEKILDLQAKKKKIAHDIISTDESLVKKLTEKDIRELFS